MKKNVSSTKKKSSRVFRIQMISFIFTVLLFTSCSKEDVTPSSGTAVSAQNESALGAGNQVNSRLANANLIDANASSNQNIPPIQPFVPKDAMIYISHGGCMGQCPVYNVVVKHDGTVIYTGTRFVGTMGTVEFMVHRGLVNRLRDKMEDSGFLRLPDEFPFVGDMQRTVTALRMNDSDEDHFIYKVVVDWGVRVPEELVNLRHTIETELGIDKLVTGTGTNGVAQMPMPNN